MPSASAARWLGRAHAIVPPASPHLDNGLSRAHQPERDRDAVQDVQEIAAYEGREELDALEHAVRYNTHIAQLFADAADGKLRPAARVLDFGAGIGTITGLFARRTGVRPSTVEVDAGQRGRLEILGFESRAHVTEYARDTFDLVMSSNVLEHIVDDVGTLSDIRTRLRPGGRAAFYVPAFPMLWTGLDDRVGHVRRYTRATLRAAFEQAGFEVLRVEHKDSLGFLATLAVKWLRRDAPLRPGAIRLYDRLLFPASLALDVLTKPLFGKNLFIVARRPS